MAKAAHIIDHETAEVGDKVLGICGTKFTMQYKWADMPDDMPYCRNCVDTAIACMTDGANLMTVVAVYVQRMINMTSLIADQMEDNALVQTVSQNDEFYEKQITKRLAKQAKKAAKAAESDVETRPAVDPKDTE